MKRSTKIIALVLALVMVFLLIPITTVSAANIPGGTVLYLVPSANWNQSNARFAAYFFGDGEAWVSMTKVAGESNLYQVTTPAGKNFTNVIFCRMNPSASANNWNNKWNQTSDLVYNGTSNCYTVKEGTWDKGGGTWSTYGSACAHANVGAAATCTTAQVCLDCGDPVVDALGHTYNSAHLCTRCNGQATFTVAGSGAHLGTEWDTGNKANDMTFADGVYTKVYTNVAAGSYLLKVARDHDWGTAYPSADKAYTVSTAGSTVTVTLKGTTVNVVVEAPHTHAFSDATCTEAPKCECGVTEGEALGHNFENGACTRCEAADPDYVPLISGTGTEEDPFVIGSLEALIAFRDSVNAGETKYNADGVYVTLGADIDMSSVDWSVNIGDDCNATFDGIFDGKGHKISNLTAKETAQKADGYVCGGLFGAIYGNAVIKNLTIENVSIDAGEFTGNNVAAVVGFVYAGKGSIENVTVCGDIAINANGIYGVGAIIGYAYESNITVKDCKVVGNEGSSIKAASGAGAIVGYAKGVHVVDASVSGLTIEGAGLVGGIIGIAVNNSTDINGAHVANVTLNATKDVWVNGTGIAVGTLSSNSMSIEGVTFENVTGADTLLGSAYAEKPTTVVPAFIAKAGDVYYTDLQEVLNAASTEAIELLVDVKLDAPLVITGSSTLDLNGFTLSYESTNMGEAMITNKGNLTINDSVGTGVINYNYVGANDASYGKGNYTISNGGTLTVNGGKITIANLRQHAKYPIDNNSTTGDAILVINGGHLYNYNTSAIRQFCNSTTNKNSVTINGGIIEGYSAIWMQNPGKNTVNGDLTITGGEIRTTAAAWVNGTSELKDVSSALYCTIAGEGGAWSETSFVVISGGTINENVYLAEEAPASLTIGEAAFNGYVEVPHVHSFGDATCTEPAKCSCGLTDGEALGHNFVDGVCSRCEEEDPNYEPPHVHKDTGLDAKCDECGEWFLPTSPFKLEMYQASKKQTYYFTGAMSGYYFATSTDITKAVDLYAEAVEGGYNVYFMNGSTKNYLYIELSGTHINAKFGSTKAVWYVDETYGCLTTEVSGTKYFLGTYSSYVTFGGTAYSRLTASTADVSQYVGRAVSLENHVCEDFTSTVTAPKCTTQGYTTKTCTACGVSTKVDYVDALGHDLVDVEGLAPTCTATGYTAHKDCSRCTYVEGKETVDALGHKFFAGACTVCEAADPDYNAYLLNFSQWPEFAKETYADGDIFKYNDIFTFIMGKNSRVDASAKTWEDFEGTLRFSFGGKTPTGSVPSKNALQITADGAYTIKVWYVAGGDARYFALMDAEGTVLAETTKETVKNGQYYAELVIPAEGTYFFGVPGDNNYIFQIELVKHEHTFTDTVVAPTCTEAGYTSHACDCGYTYTDTEVEALGHDLTVLDAVAPTCTETGLTAGESCSRCDHKVEQTVVDALGHDIVTDEAVEPTCTETGLTAGEHCTRCDHKVEQTVVDALGHTYVEGKCECGAEDPDFTPDDNTGDDNGDDNGDDAQPLNFFEFLVELFKKLVELIKNLFKF